MPVVRYCGEKVRRIGLALVPLDTAMTSFYSPSIITSGLAAILNTPITHMRRITVSYSSVQCSVKQLQSLP